MKPMRYNSLDSWTIMRICEKNGVHVDWTGDRVSAELPSYWNGKMRMVCVELTNMTKQELLEAIA